MSQYNPHVLKQNNFIETLFKQWEENKQVLLTSHEVKKVRDLAIAAYTFIALVALLGFVSFILSIVIYVKE